jgi:thiol-disulfide isomerase/thioredoxin
MSEGPSVAPKPKSVLTWLLWGAALVGVAAVVYIMAQASTKEAPKTETAAKEVVPPFSTVYVPTTEQRAGPDYAFYDQAGKPVKVADLKGKVVVMNLWATWCAPCVVEMPTLAKLQAEYAGKDVEVVTVSIDGEAEAAKARLFIAKNEPLKFYHDRESKMPFQMQPSAGNLPATVIYGKDGMELGRVAGPADWEGADVRAVLDKALAAS